MGNPSRKITSVTIIANLLTMTNNRQTKKDRKAHTMNEAVFHTKNPDCILTNRKHLKVN